MIDTLYSSSADLLKIDSLIVLFDVAMVTQRECSSLSAGTKPLRAKFRACYVTGVRIIHWMHKWLYKHLLACEDLCLT